MMKSTLEILPLAVITAVLFSFVNTENNQPDHISLTQVERADKANYVGGSQNTDANHTDLLSRKSSDSVILYDGSPETELGSTQDHQFFLERKNRDLSVPYYSSKDIYEAFPRTSRSYKRKTSVTQIEDPKIDINRANAQELQSIPGIGPTRAQSIVSSRPMAGFSDWDDLLAIPGIGDGTLFVIKTHAKIL
ncbi:MAG: helix-hairpin-helix domain-containing protein [Candidatus Lindowbacteria bacterium]|nr:helix-hairpin-helix domain-containing protein [Candidatus Lindowbacteria bacterium]